jgi:hypothetical protein
VRSPATADAGSAAARATEAATAEALAAVQVQEVQLSDEERQRCEVWTRVMGYHRPVSSFNIGKQGEHAERTPFREPALV